VRAVQHWVLFLAQHWLTVGDCLPIIEDRRPIFECLEPIVHPAFDAYRDGVVSEHLLRRQVSILQHSVDSGLVLALVDASVFQHSYFPQAYDYGSDEAASSLLLLERAIFFAKKQKSRVEIVIFLGHVCSSSYSLLRNQRVQLGRVILHESFQF
jgi:hypothetical protein